MILQCITKHTEVEKSNGTCSIKYTAINIVHVQWGHALTGFFFHQYLT